LDKLKKLDKQILIGILLTIGFLVIYLVTFPPNTSKQDSSTPSDSQTNPEQAALDMQLQNTLDTENYNTAIITVNNAYCQEIRNAELKADCLTAVPVSAPPIIIEEPKNSIDDTENYNTAFITKDSTYCSLIVNETFKKECVDAVAKI